MIVEEQVENHPNLIKRFSNLGLYIQNDQTHEIYSEAIDIKGLYTYTETDKIISYE